MFKKLVLAGAAAAALVFAGPAFAAPQTLLSVAFEPRPVAKIEAGSFHFTPGQPAPLHTHEAPAVGIVVKGTIHYQVEGQPLQVLRAGDAFYEPVGPKILRFDNGSATEEAVFIDTNWQRADDAFIHFDEPPTAKIDRRTLTTALSDGAVIGGVDVTRDTLGAGEERLSKRRPAPVYVYVTDGALDLFEADLPVKRVEAGQSFAAPRGAIRVRYVAANGAPATLVTFEGKTD